MKIGEWNTLWLNLINIHAWGMLNAFDWNFPSWSISVEFAAYLTFPLISVGLAKYRQATLALLGILILPAFAISRDNWEQTALLHGLPMFFVGVLIFQFRPNWTEQKLSALQIVSTISLAGLCTSDYPML
jgi:peptidoglycan/LPS O-acetylase OafA/YrhL